MGNWLVSAQRVIESGMPVYTTAPRPSGDTLVQGTAKDMECTARTVRPRHFRILRSSCVAVSALVLSLLLASCDGGSGAFSLAGSSSGSPRESVPPVVVITAPTSEPTYEASDANLSLGVTATDNAELQQLTWSNNSGSATSLPVSGTITSTTFNIALLEGSNVITVSAQDASGNTDQQQLTVNYTPVTSNSATLEWDPVVDNNLSGYRIYFGTAPGTYSQSAGQGYGVGNVTTYRLAGLSSATRYYFAVTAVDYLGNESAKSNETYKDVQ